MVKIVKDIFDNRTLIMVLLIAIVSLLIDGPKLKRNGFTKELAILKGISYFYIVLTIGVFILLKRV